MPFPGRLTRRLIQGQGGSTPIELLVAMALSVLVLGMVHDGFAAGSEDQRRVEARVEALVQAQLGLERMTRALRQASWVYFRSSHVIDLETMVRSTPGGAATARLVRFDCSSGVCERLEGPATAFPPPAQPTFTARAVLVGADPGDRSDRAGRLVNFDVFSPRRIDRATGRAAPDYLQPDLVHIRLRFLPATARKPFELVDGASLRNRTRRSP